MIPPAKTFYLSIQAAVREKSGKRLSPVLKRWRNTLSGDTQSPEFNAAVNRFLVRHGKLDAGDSREKRHEEFNQFIELITRATGDAPGVVGAWFQTFAAGNSELFPQGICGDVPKCEECALKDGCRYLVTGGRVGTLSGQALAQQLALDSENNTKSDVATPAPYSPEAAELIAFTLSAGVGGAKDVALAQGLLRRFHGLRGLFKATAAELRTAKLNSAQTARIRSAAELCQLWSQQDLARGKPFTCSKDFYEHFHLRLRDLKKERFYTVSLDQKHRLLGEELVSEGTLTEALVHPREVFSQPLNLRAAAVAVLHNHPSGDPGPSKADKALTQRLKEAAELMGIRLLDHIVVGDGKFFSFADEGLL